MRHRHLVGHRWSLAAIDDCLENGSLREWRGLMRAVWAEPYGKVAAGVEHMLDARQPHLAEPYEGGIQEQAYWLWRGFVRDARSHRDERETKKAAAPDG